MEEEEGSDGQRDRVTNGREEVSEMDKVGTMDRQMHMATNGREGNSKLGKGENGVKSTRGEREDLEWKGRKKERCGRGGKIHGRKRRSNGRLTSRIISLSGVSSEVLR